MLAANKIETFSLMLSDALPMLRDTTRNPDALARFEALLTRRLGGCERLLRWAVISVSGNDLLCEGAYLRQSA